MILLEILHGQVKLQKEIRVATELASSLISLKNATETKPTTTAGTNGNNINTTVARINGLLDEAISSRISHNALNNATTQALVLSNIANEIYNNYGKALGIPPARILSMAGVAMSSNGGSSNNMMATAGSNNAVIKNITDYQTAQSLAAKAQEIFNKNLKPISGSSSNVAYANAQVERYLGQLKNVIDNKASFMNVMKIVHVKIHPTLISAYNLQLKS